MIWLIVSNEVESILGNVFGSIILNIVCVLFVFSVRDVSL